MSLTTDFSVFFDDVGNLVELTEQAKPIFKFLKAIVETVSADIDKPIVNVDLKCSSRADGLLCEGYIDVSHIEHSFIEWHCDTCEASGRILNWQESIYNKKKHILH